MDELRISHPDPASGQKCAETSGFLFPHPCEQLARYSCQRCGKPICAQHVEYQEGLTFCIECIRAIKKNESLKPQKELQKPQKEQQETIDRSPSPYWYADWYYDTRYSWHDDDFTEADESVFVHDRDDDVAGGDDMGWENDMGAS